MKLSCVTASYVAELIGYPGDVDWGLAARRIEEAPLLETLADLLARLAPARLDGLEPWFPHVAPSKLTPALATQVRRLLSARGMTVCACAGSVGDPERNPDGTEECFQVARMLQAPLIAAHMSAATVPHLAPYCERHGVRIGFENGHEGSAEEIMAALAAGGDWLGANLDTGNLAAQGGDPVYAVRRLGPRINHVHLKDVPAIGAHDCVALGTGIVDVAGVLRELKASGYDGWLSVEIETGDHDPTEEIIASAETVRRLWGR